MCVSYFCVGSSLNEILIFSTKDLEVSCLDTLNQLEHVTNQLTFNSASFASPSSIRALSMKKLTASW